MNIVITGTSSGIGRSLALRYLGAGHKVWGIARRDQSAFVAEQTSCGQHFHSTRVDIAQWQQVQAWSDEVTAEWNRVDVLICGAGIQGPLGPAMEFSPAAWAESIAINLTGTFQTLLAMHPLLLKTQRRAKVVCFSGGGSTGPRPFFTPYAVAKGGVVRMVENLAHEWASLPIDINALAPGAVNTRMTDEVIALGPTVVGEAEYRKAVEQREKGGSPLDKVGAAVDFLISEQSDGVSGRLISGLWDPLAAVSAHREQLRNSDIFTLRRIVPADRGVDWS